MSDLCHIVDTMPPVAGLKDFIPAGPKTDRDESKDEDF